MSLATWPAASPCVGLCRLDALARVCVGCGRTGDEIGGWRAAGEAERQSVLAAIPARLAALDRRADRSAAPPPATGAFLHAALARGDTAVVGCHGAFAGFIPAPGEIPSVTLRDGWLEAEVGGARLRIALADDVAIFGAGGTADGLLVAAPAAGRALPVAHGLTPLGSAPPDASSSGETEQLYDLGLGHAAMRFMVRTGDASLVALLDGLAGASLPVVLAEAGAALIEASPARVVETPLSRIVVTTPTAPDAGRSPTAAHTRLVPGAIVLGRLLPPGMACPPGLLPVALIHRRRVASS